MTANPVHIYGPRFSNFVRSVMLVCEEKQLAYTVGFEVDGNNVACLLYTSPSPRD